jgi:ABC-type sugar transport system permease subunit
MSPRRPWHPWAMLAPTFALLVVFFFYPLGYAAYRSLFSWDLLTPPVYVGFGNYTELSAGGELARLFGRTLLFSVVVVVSSTSLGLGLALLLNRPTRAAAFARGAVFSAYVVSWVSVALLWLWLLDREAGAVGGLLGHLGVSPVDWLGSPGIALYTLAGVTVWKLAGYSMILFIAGLQDVPAQILEAAALDGAGPATRFRRITWPLLGPTTAFIATTSLIASFQVFDVIRVMTQGGPVQATTVFVYAIYEQIFMDLQVGKASALVVVFFVVLMGLTTLQLRLWTRKGGAET